MDEYLTNDVGDVYAQRVDGGSEEVDPDEWGWLRPGGVNQPERRRSIDQLRELPGFDVTVEPSERLVPGLKPNRIPPRSRFVDGAAPPADVRSMAGKGDLAYFNRLSDALGLAAQRLLKHPESSPVFVDDYVGGRRVTVSYRREIGPGGPGSVYVLDDGYALKIGYTEGPVAKRVRELQTGNPRPIAVVAVIHEATGEIERLLHRRFAEWNIRGGEWFDRSALEELAQEPGGWTRLLSKELPPGPWRIEADPTGVARTAPGAMAKIVEAYRA